jgi:hypothetical protein
MNRWVRRAMVGGTILWSSSLHAQTSDKSMAVWVTAAEVVDVTKIDKETEKQLTTAIKDAEKARKDLEKSLKTQHGNKRETWPQEAQDRLYDAQEAEALANANWAYRKVKQEGLSDTVDDLKKSLIGDGVAGKKENVRLVSSPEQAQLIVEVNGRRSAYSGTKGGVFAIRDDHFYISFLVKAGPQLAADRFAAVPRTYRFHRFSYQAWRLAIPRADSPVWRFEAFGDLRWGAAANVASAVVEDFIAKNYDLMIAPAASR